jgi:peptidoglycan/xylan/chitin deacetylase (PgdA/CDA1 family)
MFKDLMEFVVAVLYCLFTFAVKRDCCRTVLYYHGIKKDDIACFRQQMWYLVSNCLVVSPLAIKTAFGDGEKNIVAITFDDAFENLIENAVPILKKANLPAGIFVPAGNLGHLPQWSISPDCADRTEKIMTAEQISQLDKDGFGILSHTVSHAKLTKLDDEQLLYELNNSKECLEAIVGHEVLGISYPHGDHNDRIYKIGRECGYKMGFTIEPKKVTDKTDNFKIGRFSVSPKDSMLTFKLKVNGSYQATYYLRCIKSYINNIYK